MNNWTLILSDVEFSEPSLYYSYSSLYTPSMNFCQGKYSEKGRKGKNGAKVTTKTLELPKTLPRVDIAYVCVFHVHENIPFIKSNST